MRFLHPTRDAGRPRLPGRGTQAAAGGGEWRGVRGWNGVKPPSADGDKLSRLAARLLGGLTVGGPVASLTLYPLRPFHLGATQLTLFTGAPDARKERLREALHRLRERFGEMIVVVASLLAPPPPRPNWPRLVLVLRHK